MSATAAASEDHDERETVAPEASQSRVAEEDSGGFGLIARRVGFGVLFAAALAYVQLRSFSGEVSVVVTPFVIAIALCLFPLFWNKVQDPFEPASFNGMYAGLGLIASFVTVLEVGKVDLRFLPEASPRVKEELASTVVWSYVVSQVCYLVGYYASSKKPSRPSRLTGLEWSQGRLLFASAVCLMIALPVYAYFQAKLGADLTDVTQLAKGKAVWRDDPTQTWILRGMMLMYLPAMLLLAVSLERGSYSSLLGAVAMIVVEGFLVLRTGQRGLTLMFFVSCAIIFHYMKRRIPMALLMAVGFVAILASNVLVEYRKYDADEVRVSPMQERFDGSKALTQHEDDRQRLSALAVVFYYFPEKQDFLLGESWAGVVAMPVPRWIWREKAQSFIWRDTNIVNHFTGAAVPLPFHGVLYANFSWFGVVLGVTLWGYFQRRMYEWALAAKGDKSVLIIYANAIFIMAPTLLPLVQLTQFVLPLLVIILFVGVRNHAASRRLSARHA